MTLKTLMLSGVAFGTILTLSTLAAGAAGISAVGGIASGATGSVSGAASGITNGLPGSVGPNTAGTQSDVGAPPLTPPAPTGSIQTPAVNTSVGAGTNTNIGTPATDVSAGGGVPIASLSDPLTALRHAVVKSRDGASIGTVNGVKTGTNGEPSTVKVSLSSAVGSTKEISLTPSQLSFDQQNNIVVSSLSQDEIDSLAAAQR